MLSHAILKLRRMAQVQRLDVQGAIVLAYPAYS
jgi:hypothetical protein